MSRSGPWEERESANFPDGRYFRQNFGPVEIVAQIADDPEYPAANFLLWIRTGEDSGREMAFMADVLTRHGYVVMPDLGRPNAN